MRLVTEIVAMLDQGQSNPYECIVDDTDAYIIKGLPRDSQIKEWVSAKLAVLFGLRIPDFEIVELPEELYQELSEDDKFNLGCGPVFASKKIDTPQWFEANSMMGIATENEKKNLFLFDHWVQNGDRTEWNSNLLVYNKQIQVIDHNNAFDSKYSIDDMKGHLFYSQLETSKLSDLVSRAEICSLFSEILSNLDGIISSIPDDWKYSDPPINTVQTNFDVGVIRKILNRYNDDEFWDF